MAFTLTNIYAMLLPDPARDVLSLAHLDCADSNTRQNLFCPAQKPSGFIRIPLDAASRSSTVTVTPSFHSQARLA